MTNWKTYKLGELVEVQNGFAFKATDFSQSGIPVIKIKNIVSPRVAFDDAEFYNGVIDERLSQFLINKEDILISMTGSHLNQMASAVGKVGRYQYDFPALLNQRVGKLYSKNKNHLNEDFLYYFISRIETQIDLASSAGGSANQANISPTQIKNLELDVPPIKTQHSIASILSSLDNKIELNLQMNQTLEGMAQAIFKEWFVNFNFPGFDGELVDGLPKGWRKSTIGEITEVIDCLHSKKPERANENTGHIFLQLNNILDNGLLDMSDVFWLEELDYKKWISRIEVKKGDCVITNVGRVGAVARIPFNVKAAIGRNMTAIRLRSGYPYPGFLITLLTSGYMKSEIEKKKDTGTILDALNVKNIPRLELALAPENILREFELTVSPLWDKMEENINQNQTLTQLRDSLLPRLMSGKIEVH